ncbi:SIMPL domain-containing protein [Photobacterium sp. CCB-ST2H9]|uniref:SIMPL domain-containing protein n=1 Tax=unclassified Photobacterium TaxID=2628852 RepID=UPI00200458CE|nr:SIMPL domain-containing protein [Photobacterium sp. CCB-ST2H9]UTM59551.1 SIMPL domain-containing protein [Photobacterium sp. CCB-ST2H9]
MAQQQDRIGFALLAGGILLGLVFLGILLGQAAMNYKQLERSVTVKGLSEREYPADIVIWPIQFNVASNDLGELYQMLDGQASQIRAYLRSNGIGASEISVSTPAITDKSAQQYGNDAQVAYRYTALQTVTVYSSDIETVRAVMSSLSELGKQGIVFTGDAYQTQTEYLFTRLNDIKPDMIEEATRNAREVAQKFASDSDSTLGKIRKASQGQFSISARDKNNPHIKKVRVVSTVEYYLSD